jgi:colanic acid/amylovoran biosynthesis glycosyltransferase
MALAMERLLADPALAASLGAAGRHRVLAQFTLEHHLQDLMAFLERVAAREV